jgi:hypothetical protein
MRYRLRTLLILLAIGPPVLAWFMAMAWVLYNRNDGWAFIGLLAIACYAILALALIGVVWSVVALLARRRYLLERDRHERLERRKSSLFNDGWPVSD